MSRMHQSIAKEHRGEFRTLQAKVQNTVFELHQRSLKDFTQLKKSRRAVARLLTRVRNTKTV